MSQNILEPNESNLRSITLSNLLTKSACISTNDFQLPDKHQSFYKYESQSSIDSYRIFLKELLQSTIEASETKESKIVNKIFESHQGIYFNQNWSNTYILSARISALCEDAVVCETITDYDGKKIEMRSFPRNLFSHLSHIAVGKVVKIKINEKPGTFQLVVFDGAEMGIEKEFESLINWDDLNDFEMDNPKNIND